MLDDHYYYHYYNYYYHHINKKNTMIVVCVSRFGSFCARKFDIFVDGVDWLLDGEDDSSLDETKRRRFNCEKVCVGVP